MKIFLEIKQIKQWMQIAEAIPRDYALFHLAFSTGLRISDLLKLQRTDMLDTDGEVVRVLRTKTQKTRRIVDRPLRKDCRDAITSYLAVREDDNPFMFPSKQARTRYGESHGPMNRATAHRLFKYYLRMLFPDSMLAGASTHSLRRSAAKIISQKSGRIEPASRFLGHTNTASTAAYIDMAGHEETANTIINGIEL